MERRKGHMAHVGYGNAYLACRYLCKQNDLRMHGMPNSIAVVYDLLSLCWYFICYWNCYYSAGVDLD